MIVFILLNKFNVQLTITPLGMQILKMNTRTL